MTIKCNMGPREVSVGIGWSDHITLFWNGKRLQDIFNTYTCMTIKCDLGPRKVNVEIDWSG